MIKYVLGFMFSSDFQKVVLIQKLTPEWQKDKLNGVGGKVEENESGIQAMVREFAEETGFKTRPGIWSQFALMKSADWECECFASVQDVTRVKTITDETIKVLEVRYVPHQSRLSNIVWLISMAEDHHLRNEGGPEFAEITYLDH